MTTATVEKIVEPLAKDQRELAKRKIIAAVAMGWKDIGIVETTPGTPDIGDILGNAPNGRVMHVDDLPDVTEEVD